MKKISGLCNVKKLHGKGNHLVLDGYSASKELLNNKRFLKKFIVDLVYEIKMKPITKPLAVKYKADPEDKTQNGVTATVILAESNVTIHTYPEYKFFALDIFSCREFPINKTINYIKKNLQMIKYKKRILKRGFYNGKN